MSLIQPPPPKKKLSSNVFQPPEKMEFERVSNSMIHNSGALDTGSMLIAHRIHVFYIHLHSPTFTIKISQMWVNISYMDPMGCSKHLRFKISDGWKFLKRQFLFAEIS